MSRRQNICATQWWKIVEGSYEKKNQNLGQNVNAWCLMAKRPRQN
jgi:hypothetical protein